MDNNRETDLGTQMDLNGDGIIEMGEENYYGALPSDVTYFLDISVVLARFSKKLNKPKISI